jgi:hypothetical protein
MQARLALCRKNSFPLETREYNLPCRWVFIATPVAPAVIAGLKSMGVEKIAERKYRFLTGRYATMQEASVARTTAVNAGVKDAFVIVYKNGKRLVGEEAKMYKQSAPQGNPALAMPLLGKKRCSHTHAAYKSIRTCFRCIQGTAWCFPRNCARGSGKYFCDIKQPRHHPRK